MRKRILGKAGFEVSEVGLGCWQLGEEFGPVGDPVSTAILNMALEQGVDFWDTADVYGGGLSEERIGHFIKEHKADVKVATKFGRAAGVFPDTYTCETMRAGVEGSLTRLGVDAIDLLQLHCIPTEKLREGDVFEWLRELKQEGKIRSFGASVETVEEGLICLEQDGLQSLQVIFNVFRQKLVSDLFPSARSAGVGIIVRLPLASGLLAGKFTKETTFHESDHRNYNRDGASFHVGETFAGIPFETGVDLADGLKPYLPAHTSMAQMSLRWLLDFDAVSTIIPGASSPAQVIANAEISQHEPLEDELHEKLRAYYLENVQQHIRGAY